MFISRAADALLGGGVVTCPTEGVYGLSCIPDDPQAVLRLLRIKGRDAAKGLILIAAHKSQLRDWIAASVNDIPDPDPAQPITWIVTAAAGVPSYIRGAHPGLAVRLTTNSIARALCDAVDSPLVSTSANFARESPVRKQFVLRRKFAACVDYIVPGECGPAAGPSEIRELLTGEILRPRHS